MTRRLTLRKETLAELSASELASVVGGEVPTINRCDDLLTGMYPTLPVMVCLKELVQK